MHHTVQDDGQALPHPGDQTDLRQLPVTSANAAAPSVLNSMSTMGLPASSNPTCAFWSMAPVTGAGVVTR